MTVTNSAGLEIAAAPVVELRQYTLKPGTTSVLVDLFEREFVETQEDVGIRVGGIFRDLDRPERFVWMRGFASMEARREALGAFYYGPVWQQHRLTANDTMVDSDDVLLLRPTDPAHPPLPPRPRSQGDPDGERVYVVAWHHDAGEGTCRWLATEAQPALEQALGSAVATWRTEPAVNSFPDLPVRDDHVFVWAATFTDEESQHEGLQRLAGSPHWQRLRADVERRVSTTQVLRLAPTSRSEHPGSGRR